MPLPEETLLRRRAGSAELDRIDDELFSTDYRTPTQRHLSVLPEPPTVRLAEPAPVTWPPYAVSGATVAGGATPWLVAAYPASEYSADENGVEIVLLVGIAVLLVVAVASTGVVLWWFA